MIASVSSMQFKKIDYYKSPLFCKTQHEFNNLFKEKITLKISNIETLIQRKKIKCPWEYSRQKWYSLVPTTKWKRWKGVASSFQELIKRA